MFQKILRIFRKIFFWIFFICLFLLTTVTVILHIYEDEIKQYAIDAINKRLNTTLEVRNIELSIFHDFPSASLEFQHVLIKDAYKQQKSDDTLLYSQRMFCNFNLLDIWNGDYNVRRISAEHSKLNIKTTKNGDVNYDIIKESEDTSDTNFKFILELLRIDDLDFFYSNLATGQFYKLNMSNGLVQGNFSEDQFEISSESTLFVEKIKSNSLSLITNQPAKLDLIMDINTIAKSYEFKNCDLIVGEMPFRVKGVIDSISLDIQIDGENIALAQLANTLAESAVDDAKRYNGTGILDFNALIKGSLSSTELPSVSASKMEA